VAYISLPVEVESEDVAEQAYSRLSELVPGWEPSDGNLDVWLLQVVSRIAADLAVVASSASDEVFRYVGAQLFGLPAKNGSEAVAEVTFTALDAGSYTIPAGTSVGIRDADGILHEFQVAEQTICSTGDPSSVSGVICTALSVGEDASNVNAVGNTVLIDGLSWIDTIEGDGTTYGGVDAETDEQYLDRLREELQTLAPTPIVPADFAVMAKRVEGVSKAWAIDGLEGESPWSTGNEKTITVVVADDDGSAVAAEAKTAVEDLLEASREVNMVLYVIDPAHVDVDVEVDVTHYPGWDSTTVKAAVEAAVEAYVTPENYSEPAPGAGEYALLAAPTAVRFADIVAVADAAPGVDYVSAVRIGPAGGPVGSNNADYTLTGSEPVRLPDASAAGTGSVLATVSAPS
jgi:uncharacterized phage protein gp47/JayE